MASVVDICNMALGHLGAKASVTSINPPDGSVEADWCARHYPTALALALERTDWSFARKRVTLPAVTNTSATWLYAYGLPSDVVRARRVMTGSVVNYEEDSAAFRVEGDVLYTNQPDAVLVYTWMQTNPGRYTPGFTLCLSYDLAALLAGPVLRGDTGVNAANRLRQMANAVAAGAAASDADEIHSDYYVPGAIAARGGVTNA